MKMVQSSMIALACLLAGADAFGSTPGHTHPPDHAHPTCDGHTVDLALLAAVGSSCANIAHGHDSDATYSCEDADGVDATVNLGLEGVDLHLKAICPEKCGVACGHAPTVDIDAAAAAFGQANCAALRDGGLCESDMLANWFCGESCRGGAPWDECMFIPHKTAQEQIDEGCAVPSNLVDWGYQDAAACVTDNVANWVATSAGTCPGDSTGAYCYFDESAATLSAAGSTQVNQCPGVRRRKLTPGTLSGAMMTKGVFTLTASGSK